MKKIDKEEVFAAAYRIARKDGIRGVTHRAVIRELGGGSFALGPHIEAWKKEQKRSDDIPPYLADAAVRLATELWLIVKESVRAEQQGPLPLQTKIIAVDKPKKTILPVGTKNKRVAREIHYLIIKRAEAILSDFNRPMFGVEIYDNLPDGFKNKVSRDKMYRVLDAAKDSRLVHLKDILGTNDLRWWLRHLALPEGYINPEKKNYYKHVETDLSQKRQALGDLVEQAIELLVESGKPLHFDEVCTKLDTQKDIKNDFRRSLYRRSIYDKRYKRIRRHTYQASVK